MPDAQPKERYPKSTALAILAILALTSGCVGPKGHELARQTQSEIDPSIPSMGITTQYIDANLFTAEDSREWWKSFEDPILDRVIQTTIDNAWDLQVSATRIEQSLAGLRGARSAKIPTLDLQAISAGEDRDLENNGFRANRVFRNTEIGLEATWQIDVFKQATTRIEAARNRHAATEALHRDLQRVLVSRAAAIYIQYRSVSAQIRVTRDSEMRRQENLERIDSLLEKGYATALDLSRTQSQLYQSRASLASLETAQNRLLNQLSILIGVSLTEIRELVTAAPLAAPPVKAPVPTPLQTILNRPDIRAAEFELLASAYDVNAARASLYPTLTLQAQVAPEGNALGRLPSLDRVTANIIGTLAAPILGRGQLLAQIDTESASLKAAHISYESVIYQALAEIDTALVAYIKSHEILVQRRLEAAAAKEAADLSRKLFLAGELDYTSVIVAEQTRSVSENSLISAQGEALLSYINYVSAVVPVW